jgi:drug/metabolite transporter (DMT)-like permease
MTVPKDVLRFEILLYLSLLLDTLSAALFGATSDGSDKPFVSLFSAGFIAALVFLVWFAARRRKNWARWTLLAVSALSTLLYVGSFNTETFGFRDFIDAVSIVVSAFAFYFSFTAEARRWFT